MRYRDNEHTVVGIVNSLSSKFCRTNFVLIQTTVWIERGILISIEGSNEVEINQ